MVSPNKEGGVFKAVETKPFSGENAHSPSSPFETEGTKRKPWSRRARIFIAGLITAIAAGTGAYVADQQGLVEIPGIHQIIDNDNGARSFNVGNLDKAPQTVVDGINARPATAEEVRDTINSPKLEIDLNKIRTVADLPEVSILLSIDMQKAGEVKVWRPEVPKFLNGEMSSAHAALMFSTENANTTLGPDVFRGTNIDTAEIFLRTPSVIGEELRFNKWYEKINLGNNRYIIAEKTSTNLVAGTDIVKKAPVIDPNKPNGNYIEDIIQQKGLIVNVVENPSLIKTLFSNNDIGIVIWYIDADIGTTTIPNPQNENGNLSYSVPN